MIRKINISSKDKEKIELLNIGLSASSNDLYDYKRVVIKKPWGYEYLIFENDNVAIWVLYIKNGFQTSVHCHSNKKTSLVVLSGEALCTTLNQEIRLGIGDGLSFDKGVFHSTKSVSNEGSIVLETETPVNKKDLVRLEDKYGRENKGYEGKEYYASLMDKEYSGLVSFHGTTQSNNHEKIIGEFSLMITKHNDSNKFWEEFKKLNPDIIWVLKGNLFNTKKEPILEHGDIISVDDLEKINDVYIKEEVEFLLIKRNNRQ